MLLLLRNPYLPFASQNAAQLQPFKSIATDQICKASKRGILVLLLGKRGWESFCFAFSIFSYFVYIFCYLLSTLWEESESQSTCQSHRSPWVAGVEALCS